MNFKKHTGRLWGGRSRRGAIPRRRPVILPGIIVCALILSSIAFVDTVLRIPDVEFSHTTGKCVAVYYPDGSEGSCAALPKKYHHWWVK
jgi:hypothetical protein